MEQNTAEWLEWRKKGIGASDTPILFELGKRTPYQLWREKTGLDPAHEIPVFAKAKGGEVEAQLRARYSLDRGINFQPVQAFSDKYPFMLASLDGYALEGAIEIKFVGKEYYEAVPTMIKLEHQYQMQHQMIVLEINCIDYVFSHDGINYKAKPYYADHAMQAEIIQKCIAFNLCLVNNVAPPLTEEDVWSAQPELVEALSKEHDRGLIKTLMQHKRVSGAGYTLLLDARGGLRINANKD